MTTLSFAELLATILPAKTAEFKDPMTDPMTAPQGHPHWGEIGQGVGKLMGTLGGAALGAYAPIALGSSVGGALTGGDVSASAGSADVPSVHIPESVGRTLGGLAGVPAAPLSGLVGAGLGRYMGGHLGEAVGHGAESLYSPERQAVETMRSESPDSNYLRVKALQRAHDPQAASMNTIYEQRRQHLKDKAQLAMIG